ncbi:MAG: class I SAM-dependent methyltransferase [Planctomycetia bacterium]|nr:class I SAM-dependent methyltransferase [Planctomycetia bacterium]
MSDNYRDNSTDFVLGIGDDDLNLDSDKLSILRPRKEFDWDDFYRQGTPPWDTGLIEPDLIRLVEEKLVSPCSTLEIGCGSGVDAIYLAKKGFEVTAIDSSPMAIDRAHSRAKNDNVLLRIVYDDIFKFTPSAGTYDFVYDIGFYHFIRKTHLTQFMDILWKLTKPGSMYFTLAGDETDEFEGPPEYLQFLPGLSKDKIFNELGCLFEEIKIWPGTLYSRFRKAPHKAWACLFRRPF